MIKKLSTFLALALVLAACTSGGGSEETDSAKLSGNDYLVTIKTDFGTMRAVLYDLTPKHKANFVKLAEEGMYDSLLFHRVMQNFMIQGGDPTSKHARPQDQLGFNSHGDLIDAEITPELFHKKGALAAARTGGPGNPEKKSSGSQFYIVQGQVFSPEQVGLNQVALSRAVGTLMNQYPNDTLSAQIRTAFNEGGQEGYFQKCTELNEEITAKTGISFLMPQEQIDAYTTIGGTPQLDGDYTVFGEVIEGLDVIDKIAAVQTQPGDRPVNDVRMYISVEEMPRAKIARDFKYTYPQELVN